MHKSRPASILAAAALILAIGAGRAGPAAAREGESWTVEGKLLGEPAGKPEDENPDSSKSKDVSGIACATETGFPRVCLLADDETQGVQVVIVGDGAMIAGDFIRLIYDALDGGDERLELDAEAVAYADGSFYVTGSHGRPRHAVGREAGSDARAAATRRVFRIRLDPAAVTERGRITGGVDIAMSSALSTLVTAEPEIAASFDRALDENGLTIEGLAARGDRLYFGLRGPVLAGGEAAILSVPLDVLFAGRQGAARLHRLDLGRTRDGNARGVRDLVAFESGFLLIAGPVTDPPGGEIARGDYAIVRWDGDRSVRPLGDLKSYGRKVKPEALLPLSRTASTLRLLLLFDGPKEGEPQTLDLDYP